MKDEKEQLDAKKIAKAEEMLKTTRKRKPARKERIF